MGQQAGIYSQGAELQGKIAKSAQVAPWLRRAARWRNYLPIISKKALRGEAGMGRWRAPQARD